MNKLLGLLLLMAGLALAQHNVVLSWTASAVDGTHDAPTGYVIKRATVTGGPYTPVGSTTTATTFTDISGMVSGLKFFYVITATNSSGESLPSLEVSATIPFSVPNGPTGISATAH